MFFNGNFAGTNFGYPISEKNPLGFNGGSFEVTENGPSANAAQAGWFELETAIDGLSAAEIENWWLAPSVGDADQYLGSTLLDASRNESTGLSWTGEASTSESHCSLSSVMNRVFSANNSSRSGSRIRPAWERIHERT